MRTVIKDQKSEWKQVICGAPQGSVLAPVMFAVNINYMIEGITNYMCLFAKDAKLLAEVKEDCDEMQRDLDKI